MAKARQNPKARPPAEVIDFDEGVVEACPAHLREELRSEIEMLTGAFAQPDDPAALRRMARALIRGRADTDEERLHARRLAAMLRLRARDIAG